MKIKDLPSVIRQRALECQKEQGNEPNEEMGIGVGYKNYRWAATKEGAGIWADVYDGNYESFYAFHGLDENGNPKKPMRYFIFTMHQDDVLTTNSIGLETFPPYRKMREFCGMPMGRLIFIKEISEQDFNDFNKF